MTAWSVVVYPYGLGQSGAFEQFGVVPSKKKKNLKSLIYPAPVPQNPGSKLSIRTAHCPEFAR